MLSTAIPVNVLHIYHTSYAVRSAITTTADYFLLILFYHINVVHCNATMLWWDEVDKHHLLCWYAPT